MMLVFCLTMVYNGFLVKCIVFGGFQDCVLEFLERSKAYAKGLVFGFPRFFQAQMSLMQANSPNGQSSITGSTHLYRETI